MTKTFYLSLGSNISPKQNILEALRYLEEPGHVVAVSPVYLTEPVGMESEANLFCNLCVILKADFEREVLKSKLKQIEREVGRERTDRQDGEAYAPRTIDIDILFSSDSEGCSEECISAAYVVIPLSDLIDPPPFIPFSSRAEWRASVDRTQIKERVDYDWPDAWRETEFEPFEE